MLVTLTSLFPVIKRFPDRRNVVKQLFKQSHSFQTMCEDYRECINALDYWKRSDSKEAPLRRTEYSALLWDLEMEILQKLNEFK